MKCEVILAREGGYEFYTNVKCRPYPPPYSCVRITRTPRWAEDFIYPGILQVYDSFEVEKEHEKNYPAMQRKKIIKEPLRRATHRAAEYVPMRERGGKSRIGHFYAIRIPVKKGFKEEKLAVLKEGDISIILKECEYGKYIEIEKPYNFDSDEMRKPVNKIAVKLRLRYNPLDFVVANYMKLKIYILGEINVTKRFL